MTSRTTHPGPTTPARRRALAVCLVPVIACLAALGALLVLWWPRLPDRMASHFTLAGVPDQVGATGTQVAGFCGALVAVAVVGVVVLTRARPGTSAKGLVAGLVAVEVVLSTVFALVLHAHLDLTDPHAARLPLPLAAAAVALGLLAGWLAAKACPEDPTAPAPQAPRLRQELAPGTRAVWISRTGQARWLSVLVASTFVVTLGLAVLDGDRAVAWVPVLIAVIALAFTGFRVTVDPQGLRWRGRLGLPRGHVPLEDIASAEVVQVDPSHYGGWGYRLSPVHGTALVTRGGSALRVTRRDGRRFTITVDDAASGAALLEALSHRA